MLIVLHIIDGSCFVRDFARIYKYPLYIISVSGFYFDGNADATDDNPSSNLISIMLSIFATRLQIEVVV